MVCLILDVAHVVTTPELATGDAGAARAVAQLAHVPAAYDQIPRLDLVAVRPPRDIWRSRRPTRAARSVTVRTTTAPPGNLSERTQAIARRRRGFPVRQHAMN